MQTWVDFAVGQEGSIVLFIRTKKKITNLKYCNIWLIKLLHFKPITKPIMFVFAVL